jgi:hypothetical protein
MAPEFDVMRGPRNVRIWVCAVQRRRFPVGASPTRQPLQPEAIGAVMEVTKWLKPSISVSRIGDSASVQAAKVAPAAQSHARNSPLYRYRAWAPPPKQKALWPLWRCSGLRMRRLATKLLVK